MTRYNIMWHQDGHGATLIAGNVNRRAAEAWLNAIARDHGQPLLPNDIVNTSDEDGCAYYYAEETDEARK
jgi:hypothetical protein